MHKFDPRNAHKLLSEERKRVLPAYEILRSSGLMDGMVFADIGCGNGYFTLPALEIVGEKGKVYSIDVQKEMLDELKKICHKENVTIILSDDEYSVPLDDNTADFSLLAFVLHENDDLKKLLKETVRITKHGGIICILEWIKKNEEWGPPYEERLSEKDLIKIIHDVGIDVIKFDYLNDHHYRIICRNKKSVFR